MEKILGIGNALVDIMTRLENDQILNDFDLPKGSMQLVDDDFANKLSVATESLDKSQSSGGSAANTIHGLARLGLPTGFIGKLGDDELGSFFRRDLETNKITPQLLTSQNNSGRAIALISPDSERTFATCLGAAIEMGADDLTGDLFKGYHYLHIEGYLVQNHELIIKAAQLARSNGLKVSLDMASYNIVEENLDFLEDFVEKYVDLVFANEEEAKAFTGNDPLEALNKLASFTGIAVVKTGKDGSMVQKGSEIWKIDPVKASPVDTTGAGDAYAAGFLFGLASGFDLKQCGNLGSLMAGKVIEVVGAKMNDSQWKSIEKTIPEFSGN